ncbi:MAG: homogentisate 1,2-dioxygenase [Gammaproteobacteria bacterium]|jgi:homogentisate 1,2-dioxygenase|nr:homogentisate 1,2-dioxygenase [Gammaproteobacteria bacterium]
MATVLKPNEIAESDSAKLLQYMSGFGNEHCSEALAGALPEGQFSPQKVAFGLYAEKFTATAFTAPRASNFRNWFYRIRPSVIQGDFHRIDNGLIRSGPITEIETPPNQLRWDPLPIPDKPQDFIDGLVTIAANGSVGVTGIGIHMYLANQSMQDRFFYNSDGELLIVPQQGAFRAHTECGVLEVRPGEICVIPRGMKFRVVLPDGPSRGYVCENYGGQLQLPERGPVGSDGYANDRDFLAPVAAYEDREGDFELVTKFMGNLHSCDIGHSPLDVVAWVGTAAPYKYDLARFNTMNTVTYDHPDPSIFTVLSSQLDTPGVANVDFVIFPSRWMVAESTFRPPWYHRNLMSEFMGLIYGMYDAKPEGFVPGGASLHNSMTSHGPDLGAFEGASNADLKPTRYEDTLAFMFESRYVIQPTKFALEAVQRQKDYINCWQDLKKNFKV